MDIKKALASSEPMKAWEWIVLLLVIGVIAAGVYFYKDGHKKAEVKMLQADSLYVQGKWAAAKKLYEHLDQADFVNADYDSIIYHRLEFLEDTLKSLKQTKE
jgi:hypothetical protein